MTGMTSVETTDMMIVVARTTTTPMTTTARSVLHHHRQKGQPQWRVSNCQPGDQLHSWWCRPTCQLSESSGGPDPLVGDGREPGRWGPRGTHVSQSQEEESMFFVLVPDDRCNL
jgi:hypothetical protein